MVGSQTNLRQGSFALRSFEGRFGRGVVLDVIRRARPRRERTDLELCVGYNTSQ